MSDIKKELSQAERRKLYKKEYNKLYYHFIKDNDEEAHKKRVDRANELALKRYYAKKEVKSDELMETPEEIKPKRKTRKTNISVKIN